MHSYSDMSFRHFCQIIQLQIKLYPEGNKKKKVNQTNALLMRSTYR